MYMKPQYTYIYFDPRNLIDPLYVGKGQDDRSHKHWVKGAANWRLRKELSELKRLGLKPIINVTSAPSADSALVIERFWIKVYGRRDLGTGCLCNETDGGEGGGANRVWSEESKAKVSLANKGKPLSEELKQKLRKPKNPASKANYVRAALARPPKSEETRQKISVTLTGRSSPKSLESRANYASAAKRRTPEHAAKIAEGRRQFYIQKKLKEEAEKNAPSKSKNI